MALGSKFYGGLAPERNEPRGERGSLRALGSPCEGGRKATSRCSLRARYRCETRCQGFPRLGRAQRSLPSGLADALARRRPMFRAVDTSVSPVYSTLPANDSRQGQTTRACSRSCVVRGLPHRSLDRRVHSAADTVATAGPQEYLGMPWRGLLWAPAPWRADAHGETLCSLRVPGFSDRNPATVLQPGSGHSGAALAA